MAKGIFDSPIGRLIIEADDSGILALDFDRNGESYADDHPLLTRAFEELQAYFEGKLVTFSVPLNPKGTSFQKSVWEVLRTIPYGETISYSDEAQKLHHPKATRAVANANGKNKIAIMIPCHRVIAKNGGIGGYSGGLWRKEYLLALEQKYR